MNKVTFKMRFEMAYDIYEQAVKLKTPLIKSLAALVWTFFLSYSQSDEINLRDYKSLKDRQA